METNPELKRLQVILNKESKMQLPRGMNPARWMKHAVATNRGWVNEKTGELYKKVNGLKDKIDALTPKPKPKPKPVPKPKEEPSLSDMTKDELEELGRKNGIELDKRKTKKDLIAELKEAM